MVFAPLGYAPQIAPSAMSLLFGRGKSVTVKARLVYHMPQIIDALFLC